MIYICPNCGKQYAHKGDFEKHTTKRQKSCVRPAEQTLADRLKAIEAALMAAGQLNLPVVEETTMIYPLSRAEAAAQGILDYPAYIQNWLTEQNMRPRAEGMAASNRHAVLDSIIDKCHMYDLMRRLPPKAKIPHKQQLIFQYFSGNFTNPGGENVPVTENVARVAPMEPPAPVVPVERPPPVIHYAPDRIFREPEVDRTREKAAEDKLFALLVSCENDLRPECVGAEAQNTIMQLLVIKVIQPILEQSDILDAEKYGYDKREVDGPLVGCALLKNLVQVESMGISSVFRRVIDYIYTRHPLTRGVFMDHYYATLPDIKFKKVLMKLYEFQFDPESHDILGSAYQRFVSVNGTKIVSRNGQHFTPTQLVQLMMNINRQFCVMGGSVCDPFMGTAGILMRAYNAVGRPTPDKIFGTEITRSVHQCGASNVALTVGTLPPNLICGDAFDVVGQYDNIFTNPPFGIKGIRPRTISGIKMSDCDALCANMLMDKLAPGGICSFVWIRGDTLESTTKPFVYTRRRMMEEFELIGVVLIPKSFKYTSIETVIITFRNTPARNPWLTFYQYDPTSPDLVTVVESIDMDRVKKNHYAMDPEAYKPKPELICGGGFEIKKLGDVCDMKMGPDLPKSNFKEGTIPVIRGGATPIGTHNESNVPANTITISVVGSIGCVLMHRTPVYVTRGAAYVLSKINNEYLYYYLKYIADDRIKELNSGALVPSLSINKLNEMQIHVPTPERQAELVEILRRLVDAKEQAQRVLENHRLVRDAFSARPFIFPEDCPQTTLGEICVLRHGQNLKNDQMMPGDYPVVSGGMKPKGAHNQFNSDENTILISGSGSDAGFVSRYPQKIFAAGDAIILNNVTIDLDYLYYYLKYIRQIALRNLKAGACIPHVSIKDLKEFKIHLPSPEIQKKCIEFCKEIAEYPQKMDADEEQLKAIIARYDEAMKMYFP